MEKKEPTILPPTGPAGLPTAGRRIDPSPAEVNTPIIIPTRSLRPRPGSTSRFFHSLKVRQIYCSSCLQWNAVDGRARFGFESSGYSVIADECWCHLIPIDSSWTALHFLFWVWNHWTRRLTANRTKTWPQQTSLSSDTSSVFFTLRPNASSDRVAVKRHLIERFNGYRLFFIRIWFVKKWTIYELMNGIASNVR